MMNSQSLDSLILADLHPAFWGQLLATCSSWPGKSEGAPRRFPKDVDLFPIYPISDVRRLGLRVSPDFNFHPLRKLPANQLVEKLESIARGYGGHPVIGKFSDLGYGGKMAQRLAQDGAQ